MTAVNVFFINKNKKSKLPDLKKRRKIIELFGILSILFMNFSTPVCAGIFGSKEAIEEAHEKALPLSEKISAGKIVYPNEDGTWSDYCSATVIKLPKAESTKTVISCAHSYLIEQSMGGSSSCFFMDQAGKTYEIDTVISLPENLNKLNSVNDVAIFHIKDSIHNAPETQIINEFPSEISLFSLSFGWTFNGNPLGYNDLKVTNIYGERPHLLKNTFKRVNDSLYNHDFIADRIIETELLEMGSDYHYLAKRGELGQSQHDQAFLHDSGGSWFKENMNRDLFLSALTSRSTMAYPIEALKTNTLHETQFSFYEEMYEMRLIMNHSQLVFQDTLTPLCNHRDWIYRHCK